MFWYWRPRIIYFSLYHIDTLEPWSIAGSIHAGLMLKNACSSSFRDRWWWFYGLWKSRCGGNKSYAWRSFCWFSFWWPRIQRGRSCTISTLLLRGLKKLKTVLQHSKLYRLYSTRPTVDRKHSQYSLRNCRSMLTQSICCSIPFGHDRSASSLLLMGWSKLVNRPMKCSLAKA